MVPSFSLLPLPPAPSKHACMLQVLAKSLKRNLQMAMANPQCLGVESLKSLHLHENQSMHLLVDQSSLISPQVACCWPHSSLVTVSAASM